jgi:hypothetical protein
MSDDPKTTIVMARQEAVPEGPTCRCGRHGWEAVAACATYYCAGRRLARLKLEEAYGKQP